MLRDLQRTVGGLQLLVEVQGDLVDLEVQFRITGAHPPDHRTDGLVPGQLKLGEPNEPLLHVLLLCDGDAQANGSAQP